MSDLLPVSREEKRACLRRELKMREGAYPRWVEQKRMTQVVADREMRVMKAILADYE